MGKIDFSMLDDWKSFERLVADLLESEAFKVVREPSVDRSGVDILAEETITSLSGLTRTIRWVVQCKHYSKSNRSLGRKETEEIIASFIARPEIGLLIVIDTDVTEEGLRVLDRNPSVDKFIKVWNRRELENRLIRHRFIARKYGIVKEERNYLGTTHRPSRFDSKEQAYEIARLALEYLTFNGIDGETGQYLFPPTTRKAISANIRAERDIISARLEHRSQLGRALGITESGIDPKNLGTTGWGVIFAPDTAPAVREALTELLELRRQQARSRSDRCYREFTYQPGESHRDFLVRHGIGFDLDPGIVPYYLLLVGDPESIPFSFQQQLDVQYAVGRLCFDTAEEYAAYARTVVEVEKGTRAVPRRATFFGVQNPDDCATEMSANYLVKPLAGAVAREQSDWEVRLLIEEQTTKSHLDHLISGTEISPLVFSASHGLGFPNGHPRQKSHQGALLCRDWPGPKGWRGQIAGEQFFAAEDVGGDVCLRGLIWFHFGCFGAGTPSFDSFAHRLSRPPKALAPRAFIAALPQRLLGLPKGGALAMLAHVERAWNLAFTWPQVGEQHQVFKRCLQMLMEGYPVGAAMEPLNQRYAAFSVDLAQEMEGIFRGTKKVDDNRLVQLWTANSHARSYIVLGDPAVRLPGH